MLIHILTFLNSRTGVLRVLFFAVLAACSIADIFVPRHEAHFFGDTVPVFWTVFGLGCCLAMSFICKWISKHMIARSEDYYDG
jgi:hypothetical protein